jgi:hypothetical protein
MNGPRVTFPPEAIAARAREAGLTYVDDDQSLRVIRIERRPRIAGAREMALLARLAAAATRALRSCARIVLDDPALSAALPLEPAERAFLLGVRAAGGRLDAPVLPRVDTNSAFGARRFAPALRVYEVNGVGVGGLHYAPATEGVVHALLPGRERRRLRPVSRLPAAFARMARSISGKARPRVVLCEETQAGTGTTEFESLAGALGREGIRVRVADVRDLGSLHGVDLLYRDTEIRDLLALPLPRAAVQSLHRAFVAGRVLSGPAGDLDHKSLLEVLTDPDLARPIPAADRALLARHCLWTRLCTERRTLGPDGRTVDLVPWVRDHRDSLVLKPNRMFGGKNVVLGPLVDQRTWEGTLDQALAAPGGWVVQQYAAVPREPFPGDGDDLLLSVDAGVILAGRTVGILSRAAQDPVVNVARGGGLVAVLTPRKTR